MSRTRDFVLARPCHRRTVLRRIVTRRGFHRAVEDWLGRYCQREQLIEHLKSPL